MNERQRLVADSLAESVRRIDAVLRPCGFAFTDGGVHNSHCGPFACGHYCRGTTRINLSCRSTIDNIYYEHSFIKSKGYYTEPERFTIGHDTLMSALGHAEDCWLCIDDLPDRIVARDGRDRVAALIHDLAMISSVLKEPCDEFHTIVRKGWRVYSVE